MHDAHAQISAYVALAEAGHPPPSTTDVDALCTSDDDRDRWLLARARLALRGLDRIDARACSEVAARAATSDRVERAFRGHSLAAQLAARAGDLALARSEAAKARASHAAMVANAAPVFRAAVEADLDAAPLAGIAAVVPPVQPARALRDDSAHLRRLLTLSRRLNSEASVERILDEVIDTAIELTAAERGFLLLRQGSGSSRAVVSRNFAMADLEPAARRFGQLVDRRARRPDRRAGIDRRCRRRRALRDRGLGRGAAAALGARGPASPARRRSSAASMSTIACAAARSTMRPRRRSPSSPRSPRSRSRTRG